MCSTDDIKDKGLLYRLVKQDSRNAAWLGNALGIDFLEQEGKYNTKNPGHAITKAGEYAALGYLGGLYGGLYDSAGAYAAATPALTASGEQAAMLAAQTGDFGAQGLMSTAAAGGNSYANALASLSGGGAPSSKTMMALQGAKMMFPEQQPQQRPAAMPMQGQQGPLPNMYGQTPYQARPISGTVGNVGTFGTEAGNSLGMTEEERKRRLRELGYL